MNNNRLFGKRGSVRRLTRSECILLVVLFLVVLLWVGFRNRIRIETWWWHHQHGETLAIGEYRVPAPRDWHVMEQESWSMLVRTGSDDRIALPPSDKRLRFPATLLVSDRSTSWDKEKLKRWIGLEASRLKKRGADPLARDFAVEGETLSCIGGQRFSEVAGGAQFYVSDPVTWSCYSSGTLEVKIMATDADLPRVWDIISGIRKTP